MTTGVLLMSYGSPGSLDDVEAYLTDIRGGRTPSPDAVAALRDRYAAIGGRSPLLDVGRRQAEAVQRVLGGGFDVRIGMKHWHPYIRDAVRDLDGCPVVVGLALAPHYSSISIGGYERMLRAATAADVRMVHEWYEHEGFITFAARNVRETLEGFGGARVFFTAHSLPERIVAEGDPYRDQLLASAKLIADAAGADDHDFAFQSAGATGEPWLGPDILDALRAYAGDGGRRVVVAPIGFTADHLEVLYDIDVECAALARTLGLELRRPPSPNDDPAFVRVLADVVRRAAA